MIINPPKAPSLLVPIISASAGAGVGAAVNQARFARFSTYTTGVYRYINWSCAVKSGNYQVGVVAVTGTTFATPLATTGVIACPTAGAIRSDLGAFTLPPGDYALFFWAEDTTLSTYRTNTAVTELRVVGLLGSLASGVIAGGTMSYTNTVTMMSLEA